MTDTPTTAAGRDLLVDMRVNNDFGPLTYREAEQRILEIERQAIAAYLADPATRQLIDAYFWDIKNRIAAFQGESTVRWLTDDLIDTLRGDPPDPEEFSRTLAALRQTEAERE